MISLGSTCGKIGALCGVSGLAAMLSLGRDRAPHMLKQAVSALRRANPGDGPDSRSRKSIKALWIVLCTDQGLIERMIGFCREIRVSVDWISSMVWILLINTC